ncbi:MAG: long-chain fatty acid--CoA ligase, partial [Solirubrobacteraceae bacterium]
MEASATSPPAEGAVEASTVTEALRHTAAEHPDLVAFRTRDDGVSLTWAQFAQRVEALAGGLAALGVGRGQCVALMLSNRPEFHVADMAVAMLGATPFSIYTTYPAAEIEYLLKDSGARVVIAEQEFLEVIGAARANVSTVDHLIVVDGEAGDGVTALSDVEGSNPDFDADAAVAAVGPTDVLTLIYTSGTTGRPKGVQLTHQAVMFATRSAQQVVSLPPGARVISWLPAAHIAERMAHHYIPIVFAANVTCAPDPRQIVAFLPEVRPNWFFAVPRIWEKLKSGLEAMQAAQPAEQREPVVKAVQAALQRVRLQQRGEPVPAELEAQVAKADEELFSKLRAMLGLDQVLTVNVGAAPTPPEVLEFFHAIGIEVAELWGMSETCGVGTVNRPGHVKIGTVGPASPGVELKLADDGELLCRGTFLMSGYRNLPEQTAEAFDANGWLHTGDVAEIDADGFVKIVDRKKELIINAAGKNMSPANIEAELKSSSSLIGTACCIGDMRPYNTALIVLDADFAPAWAAQHELGDRLLDQLSSEPAIIAAVQQGVDRANSHLARVEQIKKFTIVSGDWLPGGDELTPTMKLKRKPIAAKYADAIDAMYA